MSPLFRHTTTILLLFVILMLVASMQVMPSLADAEARAAATPTVSGPDLDPDVISAQTGKQLQLGLVVRDDYLNPQFAKNDSVLVMMKDTDISSERDLRVWDLKTGSVSTITGDQIRSFAISPDGNMLLVGEEHGVRLLDARTGAEVAKYDGVFPYSGFSGRFSSDSKILIISTSNTSWLFDIQTRTVLTSFSHDSDNDAVIYSDDNDYAVAKKFGTLTLISVRDGKAIADLTTMIRPSIGRFSHDGSRFIMYDTSTATPRWHLFDTKTGQDIATFLVPPGLGFLSADGKIVATYLPYSAAAKTGIPKDTVQLWDTTTGNPLKTLTATGCWRYNYPANSSGTATLLRDKCVIQSVYFSPDATRLAYDATASSTYAGGGIWDIASGKQLLSSQSAQIVEWHFNPELTRGISVNFKGQSALQLWDVQKGRSLARLTGVNAITDLVFSPNRDVFATAESSGAIHLWDVAKGTLLSTVEQDSVFPSEFMFSSSGKYLFSRDVYTYQETSTSTGTLYGGLFVWQIAVPPLPIKREGIELRVEGAVLYPATFTKKEWFVHSNNTLAHYQVYLKYTSFAANTCNYTGGHTLYIRRESIAATFIDLETKKQLDTAKFSSDPASPCGYSRTFYSQTETFTIPLDISKVQAWIEKNLTKVGANS